MSPFSYNITETEKRVRQNTDNPLLPVILPLSSPGRKQNQTGIKEKIPYVKVCGKKVGRGNALKGSVPSVAASGGGGPW